MTNRTRRPRVRTRPTLGPDDPHPPYQVGQLCPAAANYRNAREVREEQAELARLQEED